MAPVSEADRIYILARQVLLDSIQALGRHRDSIILVGAQAIYLRVGEADLGVAPYTTDGDLVLDPGCLSTDPPLEQLLREGGFRLASADAVGIWVTERSIDNARAARIAIDLLVPRSVSPGTGRRAARLDGHHPQAARIVDGLEGALVDNDTMVLRAIDPDDERMFEVRVAGTAALLVAKLHKIKDRSSTNRESSKDALDVLRLLRGTGTAELAGRYRGLLNDPTSSASADEALALLATTFGSLRGIGTRMAAEAAEPLVPAEDIAASCLALATDLLSVLRT